MKNRTWRILFVTLAVTALSCAGVSAADTQDIQGIQETQGLHQKPEIRVIAHRGASGEAPEDTLSAFRAAAAIGVDGFETDIQITKDGELVALHNYRIDGTSDGSGLVDEMTLEELKEYDFGAWKDEKYAGERIATLEECLAGAEVFSIIDLEMKTPKGMRDVYLSRMAEIIEASGLKEKIVVSAFDPTMLRDLKELVPDIRTGILTFPELLAYFAPVIGTCIPVDIPLDTIAPDDITLPSYSNILMNIDVPGETPEEVAIELLHSVSAMFPGSDWVHVQQEVNKQRMLTEYVDSLDFDIDCLFCDYAALPRLPQLVGEMHDRGIPVYVWTPDTEEELLQTFEQKPDGVITNEPERALRLLGR